MPAVNADCKGKKVVPRNEAVIELSSDIECLSEPGSDIEFIGYSTSIDVKPVVKQEYVKLEPPPIPSPCQHSTTAHVPKVTALKLPKVEKKETSVMKGFRTPAISRSKEKPSQPVAILKELVAAVSPDAQSRRSELSALRGDLRISQQDVKFKIERLTELQNQLLAEQQKTTAAEA